MKNYYSVKEIAKLSGVTKRTIQFYDKRGILKPSYINEHGYRFYSDNDFLKLQKILSLKYIGLPLSDIKTIMVSESDIDIRDSLTMQKKLIEKKIIELKQIDKTLDDILDKNIINLEEITLLSHMFSLNDEISEHYKNSNNLDVRINLHRMYSQNKTPWFKWLSEEYELKGKVLELASGNGEFWEYINDDNLDITISDISKGMINDAYKNIKNEKYHFLVMDFDNIEYPDDYFDVVIINHGLFYSQNINKTIKEIKRVLKKGGILYSSTYSVNHMKEIDKLVKDFDNRISLSKNNLYDVFGLDNGVSILSKHFSHVSRKDYDDCLIVDNPDAIISYVLSCHGNQNEYLLDSIEKFKKFIISKMRDGKFFVTKEAGYFKCIK